MAQCLEELDVLHTTAQITTCSKIYPSHPSYTIPFPHGTGVIAITAPAFGRKLNRVTGFGMDGPVTEMNLIAIENEFEGMKAHLSMCPFAHESALEVLRVRGYWVESYMSFYVRCLSDVPDGLEDSTIDGVGISPIEANQRQDFVNWSVAGYKDSGRAEFILETVARIAAAREDTHLYMATVDGKVAGTATMAIIQTKKKKVAHLYIDSTLPEYRGRGVHGALLRVRLNDARKIGCDIASVQARNTNEPSCKNIERAGFGLAYTKTWFTKA